MPASHSPSPGIDVTRVLAWCAAICVALGLSATGYVFFSRDGFNEDEFFQLAFVNEGLPTFFVQVLRLDLHPPFHYLQLLFWSAVSNSDGWLLLNSVAWHLVSCLIIFFVGRAWMGGSAGLLAVAFYALMPQVVMASTTLRFYAMMPGLAVLAWWLHVSLLSRATQGSSRWWALVAVQVALAYSHAIAFYFVFWIALAAAAQQWSVVGKAAPWRRWLMVQAGVAAVVLPQVLMTALRALMARGVSDAPGWNNDPGGLIDHFGGMTAGWGMQWYWARVCGAGFFAAAVLAGFWRPATRWMTALLLVGPYAAATVIGLVLTPMFKTPVYSAVLVPFACLVLAGGIAQSRSRWVPVSGVCLLAAMAAFVGPASAHLSRSVDPYRSVAAELERGSRPGDVVVVAKPYLFWALMHYRVGPNWGSPLEVLPPLSGSWLTLSQRLGPSLSNMLKLVPKTDRIQHGGITYILGDDVSQASANASRVWLVQRRSYAVPVKLAPGFVDRGSIFQAGRPELTEIRLYER